MVGAALHFIHRWVAWLLLSFSVAVRVVPGDEDPLDDDVEVNVSFGERAVTSGFVVESVVEQTLSQVRVVVAQELSSLKQINLLQTMWPVLPSWDDILMVLFMLAGMFFVRLLAKKHRKEHLESAFQRRQALAGSCSGILTDMERLLFSMSDLAACFAERNFDGKRRGFVRFLHKIGAHPERVSWMNRAEELFPLFAVFVQRWLSIFAECSIDPVHHPKLAVTDIEFGSCQTVSQLSKLVCERLEANRVEFITRKLDKFQCAWMRFSGAATARPSVSDSIRRRGTLFPLDLSCGLRWCVLLSLKHVLLIFCVVLGAFLMTFEFIVGKMLHLMVLSSMELCLLNALSKFAGMDKLAKLEHELKDLGLEVEAAKRRYNKMQEFHRRMQLLTNLWIFRTVPCLDLMTELHEALHDVSGEDSLLHIANANRIMGVVARGLGPLSLWYGDTALGEEKLKLIGERLVSCTDLLKEASTLRTCAPDVGSTFCFLRVRNVAARGLQACEGRSTRTVVNPFVRLRVGTAVWARTRAIDSSSISRHRSDEEFLLPVEAGDTQLEIQVLHQDRFTVNEALEVIQVGFRGLSPGRWFRWHGKLGNADSGEFEFEVSFGDCAQHLVTSADEPVLSGSVAAQQLCVSLALSDQVGDRKSVV